MAASDVFHKFTQSFKFYTLCHVLKSTDVWTRWLLNPWLNRAKMKGCSFYRKICVGFCLNTGKRFVLDISFSSQQKEQRFFWKTVLEIFKIALRLRERHIFMWQSLEILNVSNINFETNFLKTENLQNCSTVLWLKVLGLKTHYFYTKLSCQEPMLRQIKWGVKNRPITNKGVFPVTALLFLKIFIPFRNF